MLLSFFKLLSLQLAFRSQCICVHKLNSFHVAMLNTSNIGRVIFPFVVQQFSEHTAHVCESTLDLPSFKLRLCLFLFMDVVAGFLAVSFLFPLHLRLLFLVYFNEIWECLDGGMLFLSWKIGSRSFSWHKISLTNQANKFVFIYAFCEFIYVSHPQGRPQLQSCFLCVL